MNSNPAFPSRVTATRYPLGAISLEGDRCAFTLWAPQAEQVNIVLCGPKERSIALKKSPEGYFEAVAENVTPGARYWVELDGKLRRPDPASRLQPEGVHGPSEVVPHQFPWTDGNWFGIPLRDYVIYELHVGTFSKEGTFEGIIPHLRSLKDLGVTAIELMPVAQFPGTRNWGYDGVGLFAVQNSYGGPLGLKKLVNAAHATGLAVILDVVYNHLGPEGNYLGDFGPYFTDAHKTFWGPAFNFDQSGSDHVRRFFIENALYFQRELHIDALRLDAVHAIRDFSAIPFLQDLGHAAKTASHETNRRFHLIAESDLNDPKVIRPTTSGGYGLDAQWSDDFHHSLHVLLTGERTGYYSDFDGVAQLARILRTGWAFAGDYSPHRGRKHGAPSEGTFAKQFVIFAQNHDQVGNRMLGDRLSTLVGHEKLRLSAALVALSPFIPLLFMGEEYGEPRPFQYFISHTDEALVQAVREGRKKEFEAFHTTGQAPDPQAEETFRASKLQHHLAAEGKGRELRELYARLFQLRRSIPAIRDADKSTLEPISLEKEQCLAVLYRGLSGDALAVYSFNDRPVTLDVPAGLSRWKRILDSSRSLAAPPEELPAGGLKLNLQPFGFQLLVSGSDR
ncbi:MAG TPA: malto-oligosyltrehalose trehalohydrolase [Methylomirabilota bacterium]|nr:malto-oligosyltrehalose trehalohydrolase [Methylomirabilota bacterium]